MDSDLAEALRPRDLTVLTPLEAGLTGASDSEQLALAMRRGYVLYTHNISDFYAFHTEQMKSGGTHAGIIPAHQGRFSVGEQLRRIVRLRSSRNA